MRDPAYSYCENCKTRLTIPDLIPVASWLWLRGRCAHCHAPIRIGNLAAELVGAAIGGLLAFWLVAVR